MSIFNPKAIFNTVTLKDFKILRKELYSAYGKEHDSLIFIAEILSNESSHPGELINSFLIPYGFCGIHDEEWVNFQGDDKSVLTWSFMGISKALMLPNLDNKDKKKALISRFLGFFKQGEALYFTNSEGNFCRPVFQNGKNSFDHLSIVLDKQQIGFLYFGYSDR